MEIIENLEELKSIRTEAVRKLHNYVEMINHDELDYPNYNDLLDKVEIQMGKIKWVLNEMK